MCHSACGTLNKNRNCLMPMNAVHKLDFEAFHW